MNVLEKELLVKFTCDSPRPASDPVACGGTGSKKKVPFGTSAGDAAFVCQFRALTAIDAIGVAVALLLVTVTLTVPLVTTIPDQELLVPLPGTPQPAIVG